MNYQLQQLEKKSIFILRDARVKFGNLAVLKSGSKESKVCLYLCEKAFFGKIPFPVLEFGGMEEIKKAIKEHSLDALIVSTNILDTVPSFKNDPCQRICFLSDWSELDIWTYIKENNIPVGQNAEENIKRLQSDKPLEKEIDWKSREKEEIMQRLRDLGYK
jgi:3'-phosphoadenosine 5'-phosphosulfate sulfotransferase (PAPS reductase)/FAD synthetase